MTEPEILKQLKPLLVEVLGVPPERVGWDSVLVRDLGAESIDLLDLSFRIEEKFQVVLDANELEREVGKRLVGGSYEQNGLLSDAALAEIQRVAPELDSAKLVRGLRKADLPALLTVGFFVRLIARKLAARTVGVPHA